MASEPKAQTRRRGLWRTVLFGIVRPYKKEYNKSPFDVKENVYGMLKRISIFIDGMGMVLYSPFAVKKIPVSDDFLTKELWNPADVKRHVESCQIIPFCTGSPGDYIIDCYEDLPSKDYLSKFKYILQLGIIVRNDTVCIRDLFDFTNWEPNCPEEQKIKITSGYYIMTICTSTPSSGITGDNQLIEIHFSKIDFFPATICNGVPLLCEA